MRVLTSYPTVGRVGHQFSQLFTAKHLSLLVPGYRYWHSRFVNGAGPCDQAAIWEDFLDLGRGQVEINFRARTYPEFRYVTPARSPDKTEWDSKRLFGILANMPDEMIFEVADRGFAWWESRYWPDNQFTATAEFFQQQVFRSPAYQACQLVYEPTAKLQACFYRRTPSLYEPRTHESWYVEPSYFAGVWAWLVDRYGQDKLAKPLLFTQTLWDDFSEPVWAPFRVIAADDKYPAVFQAFKSCVECDIFVGSVGDTTGLVRTLRHNRGKLSIGVDAFGWPDRPRYSDGLHFTRDGQLVRG